jgi:outer membrane lipoprotein-sorting protein
MYRLFRKSLCLAAVLAVILGGTLVRADPDPVEILKRSLEREAHATYEGLQETTVTGGPVRQRTEQRVMRKPPNKLRIEYLAPPRLRGNTVVDDGTTAWHFFHMRNVVERKASMGRAAKRPQNAIASAVRSRKARVEYLGEQTVAGRKAHGVRITLARTPERHREVWLDQEHGVVLRAKDTVPGGRVSDSVFTQIEFDVSLDDSEFVWTAPREVRVVPRGEGRLIQQPRARLLAERHWGALLLPKSLPPGFALRSIHELRIQGKPVIHLRYSDGDRQLSIFQSVVDVPTPRAAAGLGAGRRKSNLLPFRRGRANLVIVGPLPIPELRKVAESVP